MKLQELEENNLKTCLKTSSRLLIQMMHKCQHTLSFHGHILLSAYRVSYHREHFCVLVYS